MTEQSAVVWLIAQLPIRMQNYLQKDAAIAKQMEKEQYIRDYNAGYADAQCNHINDAENYANEQVYQHPDPSDDETFNNFNHEGGIKYDN